MRGGAKRPYIVGAMFTESYSDKAQRLRASCERFGLQYELHLVDTVHRSISARGTNDPTFTKANLIKSLLAAHDRPVLYIDSDCEILEPPALIDELVRRKYDFAIYNALADECTDRYLPIKVGDEISGRYYQFRAAVDAFATNQLSAMGMVQFYRNSRSARALLDRWQINVERFPRSADDQCLDFTFNNLTRRTWLKWALRSCWLPKEYARIRWWIYAKPVINHPARPSPVSAFEKIRDESGRKCHYWNFTTMRTSPPFPRGCIIDTQDGMICELIDGSVVPVRPLDRKLWL
jgi:hypothetical protein